MMRIGIGEVLTDCLLDRDRGSGGVRTEIKQGYKSWGDLKGKKIAFLWSDGYDEAWRHCMIFDRTQAYHEDPRYPRYYVMEDGGGGYSFWENEEVEVEIYD